MNPITKEIMCEIKLSLSRRVIRYMVIFGPKTREGVFPFGSNWDLNPLVHISTNLSLYPNSK